MKGKLKISLFIFCLAVTLNFYSQNISDSIKKANPDDYSTLPFKLALKWSPMGIGDLFSGPNMKLGFDFRYHKHVYGGLDGGVIYLPYPPALKNNKGFFVRKEFKFFSAGTGSYMNGTFNYWGIEAMYKYQEFDRSDSIKIPGMPHTLKNYHMFKNTFFLHAKVGAVIYFVKDPQILTKPKNMPVFFLEVCAGAGIRQTYATCAGLTDKEASNRDIPATLDVILNTLNGIHVWPSFEMTMRFGWKLR